MVSGCELLYYRTFCECHIVFVGRDDFVRILLCGLFYHLEERRFLFFAIDDKCSAKDFVAAVFRVDLRETENFRVSQFASQVIFHLFQVVHFLFGECKPFFLVIGFEVFNVDDRFRLAIGGKHILIQAFVHALQHRVEFSVFIFYGEVLFNPADAIAAHVLGDLYCIGTPGSNHFAAWSHETAFQVFFTFRSGFAKEPTEFFVIVRCERLVALYGNHALGRGSEKKNHVV